MYASYTNASGSMSIEDHRCMHRTKVHHTQIHQDTYIMDTRIMDTCIMDTLICYSCVIDTCTTGIKVKEGDKEVNFAWVTRPERPKGAKDEVKQARRAQSRPKGPQARSRGPTGPQTSSM